jgi:hypothetical protein
VKYGIIKYSNCTVIRLKNRRIEIYKLPDDYGGKGYLFYNFDCMPADYLDKIPEEIRRTFARGRVKFSQFQLSEEGYRSIVEAWHLVINERKL